MTDLPAWAREHPWLLERLGRWFAQGLTGEFKVSFRHGRPMHTREDVLGQPPPGEAKRHALCPDCGEELGALYDYDQRTNCRGCGKAWTVHELRKSVQRAEAGG